MQHETAGFCNRFRLSFCTISAFVLKLSNEYHENKYRFAGGGGGGVQGGDWVGNQVWLMF